MRRRNKRTGPGGLFCAGYVAAIVLCMSASVTGQPSGDCCYDHPYPGCQDPPCEFEICMIFPECCDIEWLPHCTDAAHMNPACNCGGSEPEPCCFGDGHCEMLTPDDCVIMEGISYPGGQCHGTEEACCTPDGLCLMADPYCCEVDHLGVPVFGAQCAFFTEACCDSFPPEGCQDTDPVCCEVSSGWLPGEAMCLGDNNGTGVDDACETIEPEACCFPDGSCLDGLLPDDCTHQGGTPQGSGSVCTGTTEACCIDDGTGVGMFCVDRKSVV